ncbi:ribonuclease H-like domain-containing protein [Aspergillus pseudonomiae]|uniref:Ribonuclease H-like domain-containing protein n=1 Tax=Aspergillus pseudonomiae TaxID=1506151 RepID=A0A5N7CX09_9EURO|nr:ribonuclease H-like domain-containing protein [Aspergillus pseudonomiae]KAE8398720.1 ribonuclease H-like domain-containing protein [Aspergillus pseudonomiae]
MSSQRGDTQRGRSRGGDRNRGQGDRGASRGGRGGGRGSTTELPIRQGPPGGDFRGRGRGGDRGRGDRGRGRGDRGRGSFRGGRDQGPRIYTSPGGQVPPPSPQVLKTEDTLAAALAVKKTKPTEYPQRPGYGTRGQPVTLYANYLDLKSAGAQLLRYHVEISPDSATKRAPAGKKARQIIKLLIEQNFSESSKNIVTDYKSTLIANLKILDNEEIHQYDVRYRSEYDDEYPENAMVYRVTCQFTGTLSPAELLAYLTSTNPDDQFGSKAEVLQAMNIILGNHPKIQDWIASVGANKHYAIRGDLCEKWELGAGLEALRGFFISVRAATARLLLNIQVKYIACYQEGPLGHVIKEYQRVHRDVSNLRRFLVKLRVRVTHIQRKNKQGEIVPRIKTIAGLATIKDGASQVNPPKVPRYGAGPKEVEFFLEAPGQQPSQSASGGAKGKKGKKPAKAGPAQAGGYISVADFFRQHYGTNADPNLPVINVGTTENPSYLPVEVCEVEPGQPAKAKLSPNQTRNMLNFAVRAPPQNAASIVTTGTRLLGLSPQSPTLANFGIQPGCNLITVPGRVLPVPNVYYKDASRQSQKSVTVKPQFGSWNMRSIRFSTSTNLPVWTWLVINTNGPRPAFARPEDFTDALRGFTDKLNEMGVAAQRAFQGETITVNRDNYEAEITAAVERLVKMKPSLILSVLPFSDADLYNCIKRVCDLTHGVRNINVLAEKFRDANPQYFANVGLKVNLKLGCANQVLDSKELGLIGQGKTMLVGMDVTHPSPGSSADAPSVAGMVASVDATLSQWPAEIRVQKSREEMIQDLGDMLKAHLRRWARSHKNAYPENIIVYRDGVSEGQYELVVQKELPLLKNACKETYPASATKQGLPHISISIVGKRHNTRFYPTQEGDADRSGNPSNGTIVDRGVTEARNWDFYLQAHTALKGTARPAHYFTVWDEIFCRQRPSPPYQNSADILEALTHHMCYLFGRATKAVSICPPAYYADLVCTRARCYLSSTFEPSAAGSVATGSGPGLKVGNADVRIHPNVQDTMFYI